MKVSLEWLREYCEWNWSVDELVKQLTMSGTEVENVHQTGVNTPGVITAKIASFVQHPNADRLSVCQVNDGKRTRQIVCGAKNFKEGDIVPLATPGTSLPGGITIKSSKLRGETSEGMLCSGSELGLPDGASGLLILPQDTPLGKPLNELFKGDAVLELEVTSNRPDLLSYSGVARQLSLLGAKLKPAPALFVAEKMNTSTQWSFQVDDASECPRYTATLLKNVKVGPSPRWLQERLESIGLRPINNVVDITNHVLFEVGQPLHAFDAELLRGHKIHVRRAKEGETFDALNEKTYKLSPEDMVIADAERPVALAGVMGGQTTAVSEKTTTVLLESATFKPTRVRRAARRHLLFSDSSHRFERSVDPAVVDLARQRATQLLVELAGATVEESWETTPYQAPQVVVPFRPQRARDILNITTSDVRMDEILQKIGCKKTNEGWLIPSWRPDLTREIDLVEEIIQIEGLNCVKGRTMLMPTTVSAVDKAYDRAQKIRELLVSIGFYEAITNSLVGLSENEQAVKLLNPMTEEHVQLRTDLLSTVLPCMAHNLSHEQRDVKLFELGRIYLKEKNQPREEEHLLIVAAGRERLPNWTEAERPFDVFSLKGVLERLAARFPEISIPAEYGYLPASVLKKYGIKVPVVGIELVLPPVSANKELSKYKPLPQYPAITRDLALVVDQQVPQQVVLDAIRFAGISTLEKVECFDVFEDKEGKKLASGKKSLAYTLTYRSFERTLKEDEVSTWERQILEILSRKISAELRR